MKVHLPPGSTVVEFVCSEASATPCEFDDCTLDAVFCVGHALELAQVGNVEEAPKIRRALEDLLVRVSAWAEAMPGSQPVAREMAWADLLLAAKEARAVLVRFPQ